jgi:hypothetical protein
MPGQNKQLIDSFKAGEFEAAIGLADEFGVILSDGDISTIVDYFRTSLKKALLTHDYTMTRRLRRRSDRFSDFCNHGFDPKRLLPPVELPDGYTGKFLLVSIAGGVIPEMICLRSNDLYHRDILRNTQLELADLGLHGTHAMELGGGHVYSQSEDRITIRGSSDEFGACDKEFAAMLVRDLYPETTVVVDDH